MHPNIQKALKHLENANLAGYFEEMDKVVPDSMRHAFNTHKGIFIAGQAPWDFHQQLEVFAKKVINTNPSKLLEGDINVGDKHSSQASSKKPKSWQIILGIATILGIFAAIAEISGFSIKDFLGFGQAPRYLTVYVHGTESRQQYLLENEGELIVDFGNRRDARKIGEKGQTSFGEIPERLWGKRIELFLEAQGYELVNPDTTYPLNGEPIYVAVKPDNSLCCVSGSVRDSRGFLAGVRVSIGDEADTTDDSGRFSLEIPLEAQKQEQELVAVKDGYEIWEANVYPDTRQEVKILLKPKS